MPADAVVLFLRTFVRDAAAKALADGLDRQAMAKAACEAACGSEVDWLGPPSVNDRYRAAAEGLYLALDGYEDAREALRAELEAARDFMALLSGVPVDLTRAAETEQTFRLFATFRELALAKGIDR